MTLVLDPVTEELVDQETGEVVETPVDLGPEWRALGPSPRARAAPLRASVHDWGLATSSSDRRLAERIAGLRVKGSVSAVTLMRELARLRNALRLPRAVEDEAARIARTLHSLGFGRGRWTELALACLLAAARERGCGLSLAEACEEAGVDRRTVWQYVMQAWERGIVKRWRAPVASEMAMELAARLGLPEGARRLALELVRLVPGGWTVAKARVAVYIAGNLLGGKKVRWRDISGNNYVGTSRAPYRLALEGLLVEVVIG